MGNRNDQESVLTVDVFTNENKNWAKEDDNVMNVGHSIAQCLTSYNDELFTEVQTITADFKKNGTNENVIILSNNLIDNTMQNTMHNNITENEGMDSLEISSYSTEETDIIKDQQEHPAINLIKIAHQNVLKQVNKMIEKSNKKLESLTIRDNVLLGISEFDRRRGDPANLIGVFMAEKEGKFRIGTKHGIVDTWLERNSLQSTKFKKLKLNDVPDYETNVRMLVRKDSIGYGQGYKRCNCTKICRSKRYEIVDEEQRQTGNNIGDKDGDGLEDFEDLLESGSESFSKEKEKEKGSSHSKHRTPLSPWKGRKRSDKDITRLNPKRPMIS
ncbi:unnamed protein product [Psylliodes chrysocephalus]|uniref:Uncharacterized protein n=1 Tax=Psylliodes chrysocephalus TaxID=3402493 RepID=A0A9P0CHZ3_9CUCU|nr:unnamed protein product [Psylliodes chrysocephala]